jgi:KaiC/GvpD/RAD55 family RecA-like ATPase
MILFSRYVKGDFNQKGSIIPKSDLKSGKKNFELYYSSYFYTEEIVSYYNENNSSVKGYAGNCTASFLYIDVDDEDLNTSLLRTKEIINKINFKYDIPYESILIYFSGSKGFHIGISSDIFGAQDFFSPILHDIHKSMAKSICDEIKIDTKIYNTTRLFRAPSSLHPKTARYKTLIDYNLVLQENLDQILIYSENCTIVIPYEHSFQRNEKLVQLFELSSSMSAGDVNIFKDDNYSTDGLSHESNTSVFKVPQKGERNDRMFRQAFRLFSIPEMKTNEAMDIMRIILDLINFHQKDKLTEVEFKSVVNSAFLRSRAMKSNSLTVKGVSSLVVDTFNAIISMKNYPTFINSIDEDLDGGLVIGNLYAFIGRGGTMKSIVLQDMMIENAIRRKSVGLYFNLEMTNRVWFDRLFFKMKRRKFSEAVRNGSISIADLPDIVKEIEESTNNSLFIENGMDLEAKDVSSRIKAFEDSKKLKVDFSVIDSANAMKLYGDSEAMTAFILSRDLKEAAKESKVAISLINHARNDCPEEMRDVSTYVRGGSKFVDNCDAHFSLSKIRDDAKSEEEESNGRLVKRDIVYAPGYGT